MVRLVAGLDKDVVVVNWNSNPDKRVESLKHFADLGCRQILAGYYDGPVDAIRDWLDDSQQATGVIGAMYTTWQLPVSRLAGVWESIEREVNAAGCAVSMKSP